MRRMALAGCLAGFLLLWANPAAAETVPLGSDQDTSEFPFVFFAPNDLERAESFQVSVTAEPPQALEYQYYVSCRRGPDSVSYQSPETVITPPFAATIAPTVPEPESCWISLSAAAALDTAIPGTVRIEASGNRRPAPPADSPPPSSPSPSPSPGGGSPPPPEPSWSPCPPPAWLESGRAKTFGESCERGIAIATRAWQRPDRAGRTVIVRGFSCHRVQQRSVARVRCTKGEAIVWVGGRLR